MKLYVSKCNITMDFCIKNVKKKKLYILIEKITKMGANWKS